MINKPIKGIHENKFRIGIKLQIVRIQIDSVTPSEIAGVSTPFSLIYLLKSTDQPQSD